MKRIILDGHVELNQWEFATNVWSEITKIFEAGSVVGKTGAESFTDINGNIYIWSWSTLTTIEIKSC